MQPLFLIITAITLAIAPAEEQPDSTARKDTVQWLVSKKNGGKYGFTNQGKQEYWWYDAHSQGAREGMMNNGYILEWAISPQYDNASKNFEEGLAGVEINGKIGYIDNKNRFILPPVFEKHKFPKGYSQGLTVACKDGKYGFMDKKGAMVIDAVFEDVEPFRDNMIAFVKVNSKYGAIDLKGDTLISCKHTTPGSMTIGKNLAIWKRADSLVQARLSQGYYDKELRQIRAAERWADALIADDSFCAEVPGGLTIADTLGRFGLKNSHGQWILNRTFESVRPEHNGTFIVEDGGKYGVCDGWGRMILGCDFSSVAYQPDVELYIISDENGKFGIYDNKGAMVLPPCLDRINDFRGKRAECAIGNTFGFIDEHGQAMDNAFLDSVLNMSMMDPDVESRANTLRQLIAFKPTYAKAHNNLAACYIATEKYKIGIPMLKLAHRIDPADDVISKNLEDAKYDRKQKRLTIAFTVVGVVASVALAAVAVVADVAANDSSGGGDGSGTGSISSSSDSSSGSRSGSSVSGVTQSELQSQYDDAIDNIRDIRDSWNEHKGTHGEVVNQQNLNSIKNTIRKIKQRASEKGFTLRTDSLENWNP